MIGIGPLVFNRSSVFLLCGAVVALLYWVSGMAFGGILTGTATDPNGGPLFVLLALTLLPTVPPLAGAVFAPWVATISRHWVPVVAMAAVVVLLAGCAYTNAPATSPSAGPPPDSKFAIHSPTLLAPQEAGMTSGLPFENPPNLDQPGDPSPKITLVASAGHFSVGGRMVGGETYNGSYAGPTMYLEPGQDAQITLINHLKVPTDLHFHGMHLSPSGDQDNIMISVKPGSTFVYHLKIPRDQPMGTFWYHDHVMPTPGTYPNSIGGPGYAPGADIESQTMAGLSGTIVIGDDRSLLPPDLQNIQANTISLKVAQIRSNGDTMQNTTDEGIATGGPTVDLVNGQLDPVLTMRPGETQLWRLANIGADNFFDLQLAGFTFTVVGQDGYPVSEVTNSRTRLLPPGKRYDVLVTAPSQPTSVVLQNLATNTNVGGGSGPGFTGIITDAFDLMTVNVAGTPETPVPGPSGALPTSPANLANAPIAQYRTVTFSEATKGSAMYINGKTFNANKSVFSTPAVLGTTEQWTLRNVSNNIHPFHIHVVHFQVMSVNGVTQPFTRTQDIVDVPYEQDGIPGTVVIRIHFTDFVGKYMFHCHIAFHEDYGMMSFINVVKK
ncbi:MAG TPA: multicopper oxidase family protein [Acidimicrobiales bacterium]|nr:multicopper oxidase family protein [Acidimicrobiales bacterium]